MKTIAVITYYYYVLDCILISYSVRWDLKTGTYCTPRPVFTSIIGIKMINQLRLPCS